MKDVNITDKIEVIKEGDRVKCSNCGQYVSMWEKCCPNPHCKKELRWEAFIFE